MTHSTLPDRLLACPFCGSEAEVDSYDDRAGTFVQCCNCGARVSGGEVEWNTRTPAAALSVPDGREAVAWMTPESITHLAKQNGVAKVDAWNTSDGNKRVPVFTTPQPGDGGVIAPPTPEEWERAQEQEQVGFSGMPDTMRLNWLEHMARNGGIFLYSGVDVAAEKRSAVGLGLRPGKLNRDLREAIDAVSPPAWNVSMLPAAPSAKGVAE